MSAPREVVGRRSLFHSRLVPVINPPEVMRRARKRFGRPCISRAPGRRVYQWAVAPFDLLTIVVRVPSCAF